MGMAAASAACVYSVGPRFFCPRRTLATTASQLVSSFSFSQLGFNYLRPRTSAPASRKLFVVRAARTESKGVSLGFRAPDFELPEPPTGKVWKLTDFESYPALLTIAYLAELK